MDNQPSQEELIAKGTAAARILDDVVFMDFLREMRALRLECIGNTEPTEHALRDDLYHEHRALVAIEAHLVAYRETAKGIIERDELEQQAAADITLDTD